MFTRVSMGTISFGMFALIATGAIGFNVMFEGRNSQSASTKAQSSGKVAPERNVNEHVNEESVEAPVPKESAEDVWFGLSEKLEIASQKRREAFHEEMMTIAAFLEKLKSVGNLETFADDVTQFGNGWEITMDPVAGRACISREFKSHVLDSREVVDSIERMVVALDKRLTEIDNESLVDCGIDIEYSPPTVSPIDISDFHRSVDQCIGDLLPHAQGVWGESVVAGGVGLAAGLVAEELARSAAASDNVADQVAAGAIGIFAGWVAEEAVSSTGTARRDLINSAASIRTDILEKLKAEKVRGNFWVERVLEIVVNHEMECNIAIAEHLGVNPTWALEHMTK